MEKSKVGGGLKKKFLKQSFTLTLEELLLIEPKFLQELQTFLDEEPKTVNRSQNSGRCDHWEFEEETKRHCQMELGLNENSLTYTCPLGFIDIVIEGKQVKALVNTGAEMNIMPEDLAIQLKLPAREISMDIMGIGGHSTPIVGLAEGSISA
jgi:hypothetical protein